MWEWLFNLLKPKPVIPPNYELPSPGYWLKPDALVYDQTSGLVSLNLNKLSVPLEQPPCVRFFGIADTNSMDTFFDAKHTVICVAGATPADHKKILDACIEGDIIVASNDGGSGIIHAIKSKTIEQSIRIWRTHPLNPLVTSNTDPWLWRDENIKWVCLSVVYTDS